MTQLKAYLIEKIVTVGADEHGEHIHLTLQLKGDQQVTLAVPYGLYSGLMASLMAAGAAAYTEQVKRLGSDQNVIAHAGLSAFAPTDFELGRAQAPDNRDLILLRLKKDRAPVVDVTFDFQGAKQIATALIEEVQKGSAPTPRKQ